VSRVENAPAGLRLSSGFSSDETYAPSEHFHGRRPSALEPIPKFHLDDEAQTVCEKALTREGSSSSEPMPLFQRIGTRLARTAKTVTASVEVSVPLLQLQGKQHARVPNLVKCGERGSNRTFTLLIKS